MTLIIVIASVLLLLLVVIIICIVIICICRKRRRQDKCEYPGCSCLHLGQDRVDEACTLDGVLIRVFIHHSFRIHNQR